MDLSMNHPKRYQLFAQYDGEHQKAGSVLVINTAECHASLPE